MPQNPALKQETLTNPIQRGNPLNDPKFQNQQGYNNYDLNNTQLCSPRFGEYTPNTVFETVPGDRHFLVGNNLGILNQIDANLMSDVRQYVDYFYVPMRCVFPVNYEKIVPNPVKGDDLPWKALPQIPLFALLYDMLNGDHTVTVYTDDLAYPVVTGIDGEPFSYGYASDSGLRATNAVLLNQLLYVAYTLSRGNLLDYLGCSVDLFTVDSDLSFNLNSYGKYSSPLQTVIDLLFDSIANIYELGGLRYPVIYGIDLSSSYRGADGLNSDIIYLSTFQRAARDFQVVYDPDLVSEFVPGSSSSVRLVAWDRSSFRAALYDCLEKGLFIDILVKDYDSEDYSVQYSDIFQYDKDITDIFTQIVGTLRSFLERSSVSLEAALDGTAVEPFNSTFINPMRLVAYQQSIAEYCSNDSVDNIFTAELWMQNMRAIMFPSVDGLSSEPTFEYNGVDTEYDLFTTGAFLSAFFEDRPGYYTRVLPFVSNLLFLRRSLRYGDYFATGRPNLLAVGQLGIPVGNNGTVNPIDVSKNIVMQRFLNAVNWIGSKFVNYMQSIFGVKPSETGCKPIFIAQRRMNMERDIVNNTSENQGKQVTNLKSMSDSQALDVFIDDFGVIIGVESFDALPAYPSGIDRNFSNSDRYSMFNSMLQNVGDQPILVSELTGLIEDERSEDPFAYSVRYAQYKFGITRAHGAFVNHLPGFSMLYPWNVLTDNPQDLDLRISPDFIRDKPFYFDQFFVSRTGMSPAAYYHFITSANNQHSAARLMQYQPPIL